MHHLSGSAKLEASARFYARYALGALVLITVLFCFAKFANTLSMLPFSLALALLTAIGMNRYYQKVASLPSRTDIDALIDAGITQVQVMLLGAAIAAALAAFSCLAIGLRRRLADPHPGLVPAGE